MPVVRKLGRIPKFVQVAVLALVIASGHKGLTGAAAAGTRPTQHKAASIVGVRSPEQLDMPPAAATELMRQAESPRMVARLGPFTSIQVNVNASQNNIVGDAANESSIAISPADPNQIVIGWRQFDSVSSNFRQAGVAYSHDRGQTWTKFTLDPGHFRSDPVLGADAAGRFFIVHYDGSVDDVWRSLDGGVTWTIASAGGGDKEWLKVDSRPSGMGSGHIYQTWNVQFSCPTCGNTDFNRSINNGVSFQPPVSMGAPSLKWGTMDIGADGTLYIAGSNLNQTGHLFIKSTNAKDPSTPPHLQCASRHRPWRQHRDWSQRQSPGDAGAGLDRGGPICRADGRKHLCVGVRCRKRRN